MKIAVITTNKSGKGIGEYLISRLPGAELHHNDEKGGLFDLTARLFHRYEGLVFIMASGIVVRMIASHIKSKHSDPAVVVVDNGCRHAISLLSGHEGGANRLTFQVAAVLSARPVVTTATEARKRFTLGIGCRRGVTAEEVRESVQEFFTSRQGNSDFPGVKDVRAAATIDIKMNEEGLTHAMEALDLPLLFFSSEEINSYCGEFNETDASIRQLGVKAVAEPCALLAGKGARLHTRKQVLGKLTLALAVETPGLPDGLPNEAVTNGKTSAANTANTGTANTGTEEAHREESHGISRKERENKERGAAE